MFDSIDVGNRNSPKHVGAVSLPHLQVSLWQSFQGAAGHISHNGTIKMRYKIIETVDGM
jgi:hypothetical protein